MPQTAAQPVLTAHARQRCQQRGIRVALLSAVLENADVERPAGGDAVLLSVSRARAARLNLNDRLGRCGVILSQDGAVITVAHVHRSRRGKTWRRGRL